MRKPNRRSEMHSASVNLCAWAGLSVGVLPLCGCAVGLVADIVSVGATGKSVADHGLDVMTGQNCNLVQAVFRSDHAVCTPRGTAVATRDATDLSAPSQPPQEPRAAPLPAADPGDGLGGGLGSGLNDDPGGPSGSDVY